MAAAAGRRPSAARRFAPLALAALALLAGCGWHLQGHAPLPEAMKHPYVEAPDPQSEFVQSLLHALRANGAEPVADRNRASAVVSVVRDTVKRRTIAVSATNQPVEYELTYNVAFTVTVGGRDVIEAQELSATRTYSFQEELVLAKGHEQDILQRDMANDLSLRLVRQLSSL